MGARVEDADPVAVVLAHLRVDPEVLEAFGGPEHVGGLPEAPWDHLVVTPGLGGSVGDLRWMASPEVVLEVYGDPYKQSSPARLRRLTLLAARVVRAFPEAPTLPGQPVVSLVRPAGGLTKADLTTGQGRWRIALEVTIHPPAGSARR